MYVCQSPYDILCHILAKNRNSTVNATQDILIITDQSKSISFYLLYKIVNANASRAETIYIYVYIFLFTLTP